MATSQTDGVSMQIGILSKQDNLVVGSEKRTGNHHAALRGGRAGKGLISRTGGWASERRTTQVNS